MVLDVARPVAPGAVASRSGIREAARRVREVFTSRGYVDTDVRIATEPVPGGEAAIAIRFEVRESALAYVRNIFVRGNSATKDKAIRREISLNPGEVYDEVAAARDQRRLQNLGFFETVRFFDTPVPGDPSRRDLVYEVTERRTGQFMVGAGFSSIDNLLGYAEISQGNFDIANWPTFRGAGQKARASMEVAKSRTSIDVSVSEPWFLDRRLNLTVDAYRRENRYDEFDECRIGAGASLAFPARIVPGRLTVRYGIETVEFDDFPKGAYVLSEDPSTPFFFTDIEDRQLNGRLRLAWSFDTRNRAFVPTRGMQTSIFFETRNAWLGSDNELYRTGITFNNWFPLWFDHVLSVKLRAETVDTYDDGDVLHVADRLYLGGGRTLRGFDYRGVGPKALYAEPGFEDSGYYRSVGGQTLAMASAEYGIPLGKWFRLVGFFDIGNVWSDPFDADFGEYAASYGVGIRIDLPGFPIRFDYAIPIEEDDEYTDTRHWVVWIGFD
jgi:outer membrane protein insertion porin family